MTKPEINGSSLLHVTTIKPLSLPNCEHDICDGLL